MIHRVAFGSVERFIGILIEHFAGAFPTWLAPVQVKVLPISEKYEEYAKSVKAQLDEAGSAQRSISALRRSATRSARPDP